MELEFDREVTHCYEVAASGTVCQEETLETIVPDACPDILRIVAVCAQATLNGKQARDGLAEASGSVRAVVLYQPEEGGGLRRLEAALPFTSQMDAPTLTQQGMVSACARVRGAEARALNPRKVLLRVDLAVEITAFQPTEHMCCQAVLEPEEHKVEQMIAQAETYQLSDVQEKPFTFTDQIRLNGGQGEGMEVMACQAQPVCGECKLIGSKLIFKGTVELQLLVQEAGGALTPYRESMPFSQVMEIPGVGEGSECQMDLELTQFTCLPSGEDGRSVEVTLDVLAQAQVWCHRPMQLLQDLYSTAWETQVAREEHTLWKLLDQSSRAQNVRELLETGSLPRSVVDSWVNLGDHPEPRGQRGSPHRTGPGDGALSGRGGEPAGLPAHSASQLPGGSARRGGVPLSSVVSGGGVCHSGSRRVGGAVYRRVPVPAAPASAGPGSKLRCSGGAKRKAGGAAALGGAASGRAGGDSVGHRQGLRHPPASDPSGQSAGGGEPAHREDAAYPIFFLIYTTHAPRRRGAFFCAPGNRAYSTAYPHTV